MTTCKFSPSNEIHPTRALHKAVRTINRAELNKTLADLNLN